MQANDIRKVYASGTAHSIDNVDEAIDFGTTDPSLKLTAPGRYLILSRVSLVYDTATAAGEVITIKLVNDTTGVDVSDCATTITLGAGVALAGPLGSYNLPAVTLVVDNDNTEISLHALVSADLAVGTIDVTEAEIVALKVC